MSAYTDVTKQAQAQVLDAIAQSQKATAELVNAWAKAVQPFATAAPSVPFAEQLPTPERVVEDSFAFAQKVLDAQQAWWKSVIAAAEPALPKGKPVVAKAEGAK